MNSPSRSAATSDAPHVDTSHICEVCDLSDGVVEDWPQGAHAHAACAPGHWKKDRANLEAFTAAIHRVRFELEDSGKVSAVCLKCDWWLSDWPNGAGALYRKADEHVKGAHDSF